MQKKFPSITPEHHEYIVANRLNMSGADMASHLGIGNSMVTTYMRHNGLAVSAELQRKFRIAATVKRNLGKSSSTPDMDEIIKANYLSIAEKTLAKTLGKSSSFLRKRMDQLGLVIPKELAAERKRAGMFRQGQTPVNKGKKQIDFMSSEAIERTKATRFQKGNLPYNTKDQDGAITIRHEHPKRKGGKEYQYIRVSLGVWIPYHTYLWEKEYGKIPPKHCLWFKDGNSLNVSEGDLSNLELITRAENIKRNSVMQYPEPLRKLIRQAAVTTRFINKQNKTQQKNEHSNKQRH